MGNTTKSNDQGDPADQPALRPEWLRVRQACHYSGISKAKLYDMIKRGQIRSASLRERGQTKGTRLISFDSLRHFLESRAEGGTSEPVKPDSAEETKENTGN